MHIQFHYVKYKNLLSVGNQFITVPLDSHKTTLITGSNGVGKSLMLDAIVFGLYGKSFRRINKPQLVNSINKKDMVVELSFSIAKDKYFIRRGLRPNILEIFKNDVLLNKDAATKDYQEYLEQNILKMSIKSFSQIVILGSATYVPFMGLPAGQRREIIEDLLDIQVFSTMNILLKDRIATNKAEITTNNYQIDLVDTKIDSAKDHNAEIEKMRKMEVDKLKSKVRENIELIEENKLKIEKKETEITQLLESISDKVQKDKFKKQANTLLSELRLKYDQHIKDIAFYTDNDNCPACDQTIQEDFRTSVLERKKEKKLELDTAISDLTKKLDETTDRLSEISDINEKIQKIKQEANGFRLENKMTLSHLNEFKEDLTKAEVEVEEIDQSKILEYTNELKELQKTQTDLYDHRSTLSIVASMLKDGGIKTSIIKTYIPIMNKLINQYLAEFELFVDFNLDENFNETIKSRFRDTFSFASFSEGEKMRISLSIMFAWRAISKLRNSVSTNLLLMDEVLDSASDSSGVEALIDILSKPTNKDNIFVISHRGDSFQEKFEHFMKFEKQGNFTQLVD